MENSDLAVTCGSCKGYLQGKVDVLDLFATVWKVIETPRAAFRRIAIATHKNYVLVLSGLAGISIAFAFLWLIEVANRVPNVFLILLAGCVAGPVVGIALVTLATVVSVLVGRRLGGVFQPWRTYAVLAYSAVPVVLCLVFVFPVQIGAFGVYLFGTNPSPMVIKPTIHVALMALNSLAVAWSVVLVIVGLSVVGQFSLLRSLAVALFLVLAAGGCVLLAKGVAGDGSQPEDMPIVSGQMLTLTGDHSSRRGTPWKTGV
jgi:hypothetical protein